jgi:DNA-binding MarR family transcriptional regulator
MPKKSARPSPKTHTRQTKERAFEETLGESLGFLFRDTYRLFSQHLLEHIAPYGIGLGQWYFLRALWIEDGLTQRELSTRVGMGEATAVTALDSLERESLVRRTVDAKDARRKRITLTAKGRKLKETLLPIAASINETAASQLSANDLRSLKSLIRRVRDTLAGQA